MNNQLNGLHRDRAAAFCRMRREMRPLQVETLHFLQDSVDKAFEEGVGLLRAGKLNVRLSPNVAWDPSAMAKGRRCSLLVPSHRMHR